MSGLDVSAAAVLGLRSSREWWAGFGIVAGLFDGLGLAGFGAGGGAGKCLAL